MGSKTSNAPKVIPTHIAGISAWLIEEVGLLEYNGKCYTYIREGVGDPILGDYEVSAQLKGNVVFEIQISFTDLDGSSVTEYIYCQKENDLWVLDGSYFYGA